RLDLAYFLVEQDVVGQLAIEDLLPDFRHALRAQRVGRPRPAQWGLALLVRFQHRLIGPLGRERWLGMDAIQPLEKEPRAVRGDVEGLLHIFYRLVHFLSLSPGQQTDTPKIALAQFGRPVFKLVELPPCLWDRTNTEIPSESHG